MVTQAPRVDVIVGHGDVDIWRGRERRRRHGGWAGWDGELISQFNGTWLRKLTPWPNAVEL